VCTLADNPREKQKRNASAHHQCLLAEPIRAQIIDPQLQPELTIQ